MEDFDIREEEVEEFQALDVPDISSKDPEERKLARRIRIQKRVDALAKLQQKAAELEDKLPEKPTMLQIQLEKSSEILRQLFLEAEQTVTNVRVANDTREVDRREAEQIGREKILAQLDEDGTLALQMFEEISSKWQKVLEYNDPLHIHDDIQNQKEKCDDLIKQKDEIIKMLKHEVKMAEMKFFNDQKLQSEDISMLAKRVEKQVSLMRAAHRIELQNIEDVMIQERTNMMNNNDKRWEDLYKKREDQELAIMENKFRQRDEFEEVCTKVRLKHQERVREVKIRLERDCETLQQEYEIIKATALANSEKMDYNYQILRKREDENIIIKSNQKRTLNKLRDQINALKKHINAHKTETENKIKRLFNEVIALQSYIAVAKQKSESMALNNEKKYRQIWELNSNHATKILNKLIKIDKILHEQQMGLHWQEPQQKLLTVMDLKSYRYAVDLLESLKEKPLIKSESERLMSSNKQETLNPNYIKTINLVLDKISEKSNFLIEYRLKKIMEFHSGREMNLLKVDNVFTALTITKPEDINVMLHFFKPYIRCPICSGGARGSDASIISGYSENKTLASVHPGEVETVSVETNELLGVKEADTVIDKIINTIIDPQRRGSILPEMIKHEGECLGPQQVDTEFDKKVMQIMDYGTERQMQASNTCLNNHQLVIHTGCIMRAIREFVAYVHCRTKEEKKTENEPNITNKTMTISRLISKEDVCAYWDRFLRIVDPKKMEIWDALLYGLQKYHAILEDRQKTYDELKCVRKQNEELKYLLSQYRTAETPPKPPCAKQREVPITTLYTRTKCIPKK